MGMPSLLRKVFLVDLLQGLKVTFRYQDPKEIYTEQYPLRAATGGRALPRSAAAERESLTPTRPCALPATCARWRAPSI